MQSLHQPEITSKAHHRREIARANPVQRIQSHNCGVQRSFSATLRRRSARQSKHARPYASVTPPPLLSAPRRCRYNCKTAAASQCCVDCDSAERVALACTCVIHEKTTRHKSTRVLYSTSFPIIAVRKNTQTHTHYVDFVVIG